MNPDTVTPVAPTIAPPPGGLASHEHDTAIFEAIWPSTYAHMDEPKQHVEWRVGCLAAIQPTPWVFSSLAAAEQHVIDNGCPFRHPIAMVKTSQVIV